MVTDVEVSEHRCDVCTTSRLKAWRLQRSDASFGTSRAKPASASSCLPYMAVPVRPCTAAAPIALHARFLATDRTPELTYGLAGAPSTPSLHAESSFYGIPTRLLSSPLLNKTSSRQRDSWSAHPQPDDPAITEHDSRLSSVLKAQIRPAANQGLDQSNGPHRTLSPMDLGQRQRLLHPSAIEFWGPF